MIDDAADLEALRDEVASEMDALLAESRDAGESPDLDEMLAGSRITIKDNE